MHHAYLSLVLATLASLNLAAPVTSSKSLKQKTFSVSVKPRHKLHPTHAIARASRKYGWEIIEINPEQATKMSGSIKKKHRHGIVSSNDSTDSGTEQGDVTATPELHDSEYLSPVSIGGQRVTLDLDTGSSDLWVFSSRLSPVESAGHSVFNPAKSSTWRTYRGGSWSTHYGDDSGASGTVGFDTVNIGGAVVQHQCVELADVVRGNLATDVENDGLVGLGFSTMNQVVPHRQKTFLDNILPDLEQPVFTADLNVNGGTYEFGTVNTAATIHYTPIDPNPGYWKFDMPSYTIGTHSISCPNCSPAIADTGTSLILVDTLVLEAYYSSVPGAVNSAYDGGYVYPCSATLPDFGIAVGEAGYVATVKGEDLVYMPLPASPKPDYPGYCYGSVQWNGGIGYNILGDAWLKSQYAVFDMGNLRLGVAAKA